MSEHLRAILDCAGNERYVLPSGSASDLCSQTVT